MNSIELQNGKLSLGMPQCTITEFGVVNTSSDEHEFDLKLNE